MALKCLKAIAHAFTQEIGIVKMVGVKVQVVCDIEGHVIAEGAENEPKGHVEDALEVHVVLNEVAVAGGKDLLLFR